MLVKFPVNDKKRPTVDEWQTYKGDANTPMIGVMVPNGVYIIDLDLYKGVTTNDVDNILGCSIDWQAAELQKTQNGGIHYAFKCDETLKQGSDLFKLKGFDTRASGKGYIATGEGYEDLTLFGILETLEDSDMLPTLPDEAVQTLKTFNVDNNDGDIDDLDIAIADTRLGLSLDEMKTYIDSLGDEYAEGNEWLHVGMAVYHETGGSEDGYKLFDDFSKRCPDSYNERMNRRRWESWGGNGKTSKVTFATVIHYAGGQGVMAQSKYEQLSEQLKQCDDIGQINKTIKQIGQEKLDSITVEMLLKVAQSKFKEITGTVPGLPSLKKLTKGKSANTGSFVDEFVFVTSSGEYFHKETKATMGPRSFDTKYNRETPPNNEGEKQTATMFSNNTVQCVENDMYAPAFGETFAHEGLDYINSYRKSQLEPVAVGNTDIVDKVKSHIAHLLPDEEEQNIVINYLAHCVQYPGKKIHWAIVLQGVQGDGKSFIAEMMRHIMGVHNVRMLDVQVLESPFTAWAVGQCMTFIEELKLDNYRKYEVLNNLKPYITNDAINVHAKGKDPRVALNTTNYFALTNFKDALPIDENDRRYCILFSQWQTGDKLRAFIADNPNYYSKLYDDMRANAGELLTWLSDWKISDEFLSLKRAPGTRAKDEMLRASKSDAFLSVQDAISEFECIDINDDILNITKLSKVVYSEGAQFDYDNFPKTKALKHVLADMGYHYVDVIKNKERKNQRYYAKDDTMTKEDIIKIIEDDDFVPF